MNEQNQPKSKKPIYKKWWFIILCILFIITIVDLIGNKNKTTNTNQIKLKNQQEKMKLEIKYSQFEEGFSIPVIIIKNLNNFKWEDCKIELNDDYETNLSAIELSSFFQELKSKKDYHTIMINQFLKKDGTKFNYLTTEPVKIFVNCNKPYFDYYTVTWSK